jgi:WD40 repeat protein
VAGCAASSAAPLASTTPTATPKKLPGTILYLYQGHTDQVLSTAWSPDSKRIASGSRDETVQVWDALTGGHAYTYHGHNQPVAAVTWSPDGQSIASGAWDKTVQVWDSSSGALHLTYRKHTDDLTTVAWSPVGTYLASGSIDKTVQVWEATTGSLVQNYQGHKGGITTAIWSPDGKYIASGSADKTVQVWEAATGHILYIYNGYNVAEAHQNPTKGVLPDLIYAVDWSHNGKWIAAVTQIYCGDDCGEVLTWDALTKQHFKFYPTQPMYTLVVSPNDKYLASSTGLSQVQVALAP